MTIALFLDIYCIPFALGNFSSIFEKKFDNFEVEIKAILIRIVLVSFMAWLLQKNLLLTPQVICNFIANNSLKEKKNGYETILMFSIPR